MEFDEKQFNWFNRRIKKEIGKYEKPYWINEETNTDIIIDATKNLISEVDKYSSDFAKILNDRIELQEIKTNNSLRKISFGVTFFSAAITLVAMIIAALSLFIAWFGLDENDRNTVLEMLNKISSLVF